MTLGLLLKTHSDRSDWVLDALKQIWDHLHYSSNYSRINYIELDVPPSREDNLTWDPDHSSGKYGNINKIHAHECTCFNLCAQRHIKALGLTELTEARGWVHGKSLVLIRKGWWEMELWKAEICRGIKAEMTDDKYPRAGVFWNLPGRSSKPDEETEEEGVRPSILTLGTAFFLHGKIFRSRKHKTGVLDSLNLRVGTKVVYLQFALSCALEYRLK